MRSKPPSESDGVRTFVVVLDAGDEAFRSILDFAAAESIAAAAVTAIGGLKALRLDGSTSRRRPTAGFR
jgi:predicted DNA-binding protein with PD1-like motif